MQGHLIDLLIGHTAAEAPTTLLTRERNFVRIARVIPVELSVL